MRNDYNRKSGNRKGTFLMILSAALLAAAVMVNVFVKVPTWEPDEVYPFANAKISWEQSWHEGAWRDAE